MQKIVLATRNEHKRIELERILISYGIDCHLMSVSDFPDAPEVEETENTFEGNALLKARALATHTDLPAIADDSGLCVDALDGNPGVLSARWSGATIDIDQANLNLVLDQMTEIPDGKRSARFICAAVYVEPTGQELVVRGTLEGSLTREAQGTHGFGYDPIFIANGQTLTNAQLSPDEKDAISHRGQALRQLVELLPKH
ncbi:MAG: RdgB/HAM1 family non-canonical purine NTP pyrophosphatase [Actinobacteria bacterium]|uniref:dITP/XTP pyrophosphatase n=1 Tax=freshwater metagenome TaxID=449393 RepID=A0A6J5ZDS3_9ZZZZ|nr:RdgB/HAM1 family non-canonical purine NTP pyrophosphatase [Actinomycetota bacterium]